MKKIISIIVGLLGLSFVIVIHELGHLLAAKWYGVDAPSFSIGFGPEIIGIQIGQTLYKISLLPLGGYVSLNTVQLDAQPFSAQVIIILAGIAINIIFAYLIFSFFKLRGIPYRHILNDIMEKKGRGFMGPIAIISLIAYSATLGINEYFLVLAMLSFSIGIFNIVPIPFLDGGQLVRIAYTAIQQSAPTESYGNPLLIILLMIVILFITLRLVIRNIRT